MTDSITVDDSITIRHVTPDRAEELHALIDANREHIGRWMQFAREWQTADQVRREIETWQADHERFGVITGAVERDGVAIGMVFHLRPSERHRSVEIGYWLAADATGRGIMSRCVAAMLDYTFDALGFHRVELRAAVGNARSNALAERLGFTREGVVRHSAWLDDRPIDSVIYGMLAPEWAERRA